MRIHYFFFLISLFINFFTYAHEGTLNEKGCHADTSSENHHCHDALVLMKDEVKKHNENYYNDLYAKFIQGVRESVYEYEKGIIKIDIETPTEVIEGGLDKRSSIDSVHQVIFASILSGKKPVVVIYDTNNIIDPIEYQLSKICKKLGIEYRRVLY